MLGISFKKILRRKKLFPLESWISKDQAEKRHVFDDYGDYKYIDTFYEKIKERDANLLIKNTATATTTDSNITVNTNANDEVRRYNEECLTLASGTIENIDWTYYQDAEDRKYYLPLTVLIAIPCALLVFAAVEMYKVPFVLFDLGLPNQYHIMLYFIFATLAQTLVAFLLAREIINFRTSFSYEIGIDNNFLSYYTLSRSEQIKLLILSFVIVGIPILSILHGFQFTIREFDYPSIYEIVTGILFDTARFFILVFVAPKFIMKREVKLRTS